jgi:hypothetical protein
MDNVQKHSSCINILSRVWVTKDGVRIDNWIYWILTSHNYKQLLHYRCFTQSTITPH